MVCDLVRLCSMINVYERFRKPGTQDAEILDSKPSHQFPISVVHKHVNTMIDRLDYKRDSAETDENWYQLSLRTEAPFSAPFRHLYYLVDYETRNQNAREGLPDQAIEAARYQPPCDLLPVLAVLFHRFVGRIGKDIAERCDIRGRY